MKCVSLFSGSSGNCLYVAHEGTELLVDAGVSARRICAALRALDTDMERLCGIFITHEHTDHCAGLATLIRHFSLPLFMAAPCAAAIYESFADTDAALADRFASLVRTVEPDAAYDCGALVLSPFSLPHDSAACLGVVLGDEANEKQLGVATDLGQMSAAARRALCGCPAVVLESNHDPEMLSAGPYPAFLKQRILSDVGHLSNPASAAALQALAQAGLQKALLYHLSRDNNTPSAALFCARAALREIGVGARDISLCAAAPFSMTAF